MTKDYPGEHWKTIEFDFENINKGRIEISNFGRLRSFNKISNGKILNGSMINGYRIIHLRLFKPRAQKKATELKNLQDQILMLKRKLKSLKDKNANNDTINETIELIEAVKMKFSKKLKADVKERTIHYHSLVHRLVAEYFLKKPTAEQTIVAHLDHNKLNNRAHNLKWMTPEQNYAHNKNSPHVIKELEDRKLRPKENSKATKLTVTKVMLMKKLINEGKPMKQLVKIFKVTETQILRIKRGENWSDIDAAK